MFHEGDIVELVNSSKSNILNRPGVSIGSLFVVRKRRFMDNVYIWIIIVKGIPLIPFAWRFKLIAKRTKFGYIMI